MYYFVERSVVVIKPKKAFLDWVNTVFTEIPKPLNLDELQIDCNSYLIPEVEEIEDGINFIDDKFEDLFELELSSWTEDKSLWPKNLNLKMFWEWFDVQISPTTIDLSHNDINNSSAVFDSDNVLH